VKLSELLNKYAGDKVSASASTSGASVANVKALATYIGLYMYNKRRQGIKSH
jgi:TRAP-type uncharacterized transport system substrate-binding protein